MRIETLVAETRDEFTQQVLNVLQEMIFRNKDETQNSLQQRQEMDRFRTEFEKIYRADDLKGFFNLIWKSIQSQSDECMFSS